MPYGIAAIIIASVLFGITPSANNYVLLHGMEADCLLVYQAVTMALGTAVIIAFKRISIKIPGMDIVRLMALGVIGMGVTDYLLNRSYEHLPVSTVVMLHFMYPTIVLLVTVLLFHQRPSRFTIGAVLLSITGLILVTDFQGDMDLTGIMLALGSAATYAFFAIANDHGSVNRFPLIVKLFYMSLSTVAVYSVKTFASGNFSLPSDGTTAFVAIGIVGLGSLLAFYLVTAGIKRIGASKASFLNMLEPITGVILGVLLYQENFPLRAKFGCLCVLLSVLLIAADGRKQAEVSPSH